MPTPQTWFMVSPAQAAYRIRGASPHTLPIDPTGGRSHRRLTFSRMVNEMPVDRAICGDLDEHTAFSKCSIWGGVDTNYCVDPRSINIAIARCSPALSRMP